MRGEPLQEKRPADEGEPGRLTANADRGRDRDAPPPTDRDARQGSRPKRRPAPDVICGQTPAARRGSPRLTRGKRMDAKSEKFLVTSARPSRTAAAWKRFVVRSPRGRDRLDGARVVAPLMSGAAPPPVGASRRAATSRREEALTSIDPIAQIRLRPCVERDPRVDLLRIRRRSSQWRAESGPRGFRARPPGPEPALPLFRSIRLGHVRSTQTSGPPETAARRPAGPSRR